MLKKDKSLIGKKVRSSYDKEWYFNGATIIDVTDEENGIQYYLLEKNGNKEWRINTDIIVEL